tara:strand:- start:524 stop:1012 length:489 start_codon:yes stop_codon:yes gene_type:complete
MAHFAEINADNIVTRVLVVHNDVTDLDGVEDEQQGIDFLEDLLPGSGPWVQTSYNGAFRHNFAGSGMTYDPAGDAFYAQRPLDINEAVCESWALDENYVWQPPTPNPGEDWIYYWDENFGDWVTPGDPPDHEGVLRHPADTHFLAGSAKYIWDTVLREWLPV